MAWINIVLLVLAFVCLAPVAVLCAECVAALLPSLRKRREASVTPRPGVAVVVPAHNEEAGLEATLRSIRHQLGEGDQILVVADNCTDRTAAVARRLGVGVVERFDARDRGKGFALDCGVAHLRRQPQHPAIVVMIDADCTVQPGAIDALARQVLITNRPAQACYLMERPTDGGPRELVSALAFLVKNLVRPLGLGRMGLPCLLTGTGMAFPWHTIAGANLASDNIVEDMKLSLDLALHGKAPLFCREAQLIGRLPATIKVAYGQRTRWEHGHLQTVLTQVPRLFKAGLRHRAGQAIALGLELSVPPLALLMMGLLGVLAVTSTAALFGVSWLPAKLIGGSVVAMGLCLLSAWAKFGRQSLPFGALLAAPLYMAWKVPMYVAFLFHRQTEWNRTARPEPETQGFELPPVGAGDVFDRDYNRDVPSAPAQLKLGDLVRPTRTAAACVEHVFAKLALRKGGIVVLPTVEHLQWCTIDQEFARVIAGAELVADEGAESPLMSTPATQATFVGALIRAAAEADRSLFLLGDDAEITAEAAAALTLAEPRLRLAGIYSAPNGFDSDHEGFQHVTRAILRARPDLVLVALGTPKQERLIDKLQDHLPATWWMAVGSSFEFVRRETRRSRVRGMEKPKSGEPLDELGQLLARGVGNITVADRGSIVDSPPPAPPSTIVYQSFLMGLRTGWDSVDAAPAAFSPDGPLSRLKALILLGGSIRPSPLSLATGRSVLDLPLEDGRSILWHWRDHAVELRLKLGMETLPVQVLVDAKSPAPRAPKRGSHVPVTVQCDASAYRGTAGVLRDLITTAGFAQDDYVLVATAAQMLLSPLWETAAQLAAGGGDVVIVNHADGTPSGLTLIRCGAVSAISATGYIDLKEQALPQLAKRFDVRHLPCPMATGLPIRTAGEYIAAVQHRHRQQLGRPMTRDPFAEDCRPSFSVVEDRASVHPTAQVHDSVIMQGAQIGEGAIVIRSVICPGARLPRNQQVIDGVLLADVKPIAWDDAPAVSA